jgi:hypothetical protein
MSSRKHAQICPSPVPVALLLIDVLTTFQFPDGDAILQGALAMRDALVSLKARTREVSIPALYVNDNFGEWRSEKEVLMGRCLEAKGAQNSTNPSSSATELIEILRSSAPGARVSSWYLIAKHSEALLPFR